MEIKGKIVSGTNEGEYFMSLEVYLKQFIEILGFKPFPGTLNIKIKTEDVDNIHKDDTSMIIVKGSGKLGDVKLLPVTLNDKIEGALVFPLKTRHQEEILEFIAQDNLRKNLNLQDGDLITLNI